MQGGRTGHLRFDDAAFVRGDLAPECLGVPFHRFRCDGEAGQIAQQGTGTPEAGPGRGDPDHAQCRRRQNGVLHAWRTVARAEAMAAMLAVMPGALQRQGAESGGEGPGPTAGEARLAAAVAGQAGFPAVGMVGVEPAGDGPPHDPQGHAPGFGLDRLEVVDDARTDQPLGFGGGRRRDLGFERPLFEASPPSRAPRRRASASASLASRKSDSNARKR